MISFEYIFLMNVLKILWVFFLQHMNNLFFYGCVLSHNHSSMKNFCIQCYRLADPKCMSMVTISFKIGAVAQSNHLMHSFIT